jgi:hypothetical protein
MTANKMELRTFRSPSENSVLILWICSCLFQTQLVTRERWKGWVVETLRIC